MQTPLRELRDAITEYIDYLPEARMSPELAAIWRMCDDVLPYYGLNGPETTAALRVALGSALDNLPDVAGDPTFGAERTAECCKDIAAMAHLLATDEGGRPNIEAYL